MAKLVLVCGSTGAGKTTYAMALSRETSAVRFSIDPWMQTLYAKDMKSLDYEWITERVTRCCEQIWEVSEQILGLDGAVVLDLGFTTRRQRAFFAGRASDLGIESELHYLDVPLATRRKRIAERNRSKDPALYSFEVTDLMFDFMEPRFEIPDESELRNGRTILNDDPAA